MQLVIQNIIRFIVLILIQVFLLDNIQVMGYITPMIYILFILLLPIENPRWLTLILAFALGSIIDMFNNTGGMHAFATVFIAFIREPTISLFVSDKEEIAKPTPSFDSFGRSGYLKYLVSLVFIHHFLLFAIDSFSLFDLKLLVPKILISSLITIILLLATQAIGSLYKR